MSRALISAAACLIAAAAAQTSPQTQTQNKIPEQLRNVSITPKLNSLVPPELGFRDETGRAVRIGDYTGKRPLVLALVYYQCPRLCSMILSGLLKAVKGMPYEAGKDFDVLAVSFDPREKPALAAEKKRSYVEQYGRRHDGAGWHFLTGDRMEIERLTHAVGYGFQYDARSDQFSHASALIVLTPAGKVSRYLYGIEHAPRDLRLALVDAAAGRAGTTADRILLYCFQYDSSTGRYSANILRFVRLLGIAMLVVLGAVIAAAVKNHRAQRQGVRP
jgi:protein SCO1/2